LSGSQIKPPALPEVHDFPGDRIAYDYTSKKATASSVVSDLLRRKICTAIMAAITYLAFRKAEIK
jgi:hypothetical protein